MLTISAYGSDGNRFALGAQFIAEVDGTPTANANSMPGAWNIRTTGSGNTAPTSRMYIDSTGNVGVGTITPANRLDVVGAGNFTGNVSASFFIGNGSALTGITASGGTSIINGTSNVVVAASGNVTVGVSGTNNVLLANSAGVNIAGYANIVGNANINLAAGRAVTIAATAPPTVDMLVITNTGQNVATAGVSAMQVNYIGGTGAIEASAIRSDMTPGTTSGSTWNAFRVAATTAAETGVTFNGIKFDDKTAGTGNSRALYVGTGYDDILNYNGTSVIYGNGTINSNQISGLPTTGKVVAISLGMAMP
jgi:hypothetical protein